MIKKAMPHVHKRVDDSGKSSILLLFLCLFLFSFTLDHKLSDPLAEDRAVNLFKILKCLTCLGESVYESNSQLAHDLRTMIRQKITEGYSNTEILAYLQNNYGERILNYPQFKAETYLLWIFPLLVLVICTGFLLFYKFSYTKKTL